MKLSKLLEGIEYGVMAGSLDVEITSIEYDSRKVGPGSLFVCLKGFKSDGHEFIPKAIEQGAVAVLVEDAREAIGGETVVEVVNTRAALAIAAANFFDHPAKKMTVVGITGTKGKTTTTHMLKAIYEDAGHKCGMIGTLGAFIGAEKIPTKNTTPESFELHSLFDKMYKAGCDHVFMEVSSQALKMHRTDGIEFDFGAFLNISPDHISEGEHKDFEEYFSCKQLLFNQAKKMIINADDEKVCAVAKPGFITTSCQKEADYKASGIKNFWTDGVLGVDFTLSGKLDLDVKLGMPGEFNVENALIAIAIASEDGVSTDAIKSGLKRAYVKGRTQVIREAAKYATFIIDYAHNELSIEALLTMLKAYEPERLICLYGGGGDRAKERRFAMGRAAAKYADLSVLTMDNPRHEEIASINADIIEGINEYDGQYEIIIDRAEAIKYLIDNCKPGDIVALIGKGHEEYQEIGDEKHFFSEELVIKEYVASKQ